MELKNWTPKARTSVLFICWSANERRTTRLAEMRRYLPYDAVNASLEYFGFVRENSGVKTAFVSIVAYVLWRCLRRAILNLTGSIATGEIECGSHPPFRLEFIPSGSLLRFLPSSPDYQYQQRPLHSPPIIQNIFRPHRFPFTIAT